MQKYILNRILLFIPTLLLVSIFAFLLSTMAPGDPAQRLIQADLDQQSKVDIEDQNFRYQQVAEKLNLHFPRFYFSIKPLAYPDTLHRILPLEKRAASIALIQRNGNWPSIQRFQKTIEAVRKQHQNDEQINALLARINLRSSFVEIENDLKQFITLIPEVQTTAPMKAFIEMQNEIQGWKKWIPSFQWNGLANQYHQWAKKFLTGDFGISMRDGRPTKDKITEALKWTLSLNLLALFFVFLFSIPLGLYQAKKNNSLFDKITSQVFYVLFAIPIFWLATIFVVFFTTEEYGAWTNWFPTVGLYIPSFNQTFWQEWLHFSSKLILPIICIVLVSMAYLSKQMKNSVLDELSQNYIRTALAKGMSQNKVIRKHAFVNALFPMITILASALPASIASSVVIEVIFNIPGIGRMMLTSILAQDWPVVFSIVMLIALVTLISFLIADLLYAWVNPKVKYHKDE